MSFNHTGDVATFTFHRKDIGNVSSFDLWIAADSDSGGPDFAPSGAMWTYTLSATKVTLVAGKVVASPATHPSPGKRFVVSMAVTRKATPARRRPREAHLPRDCRRQDGQGNGIDPR